MSRFHTPYFIAFSLIREGDCPTFGTAPLFSQSGFDYNKIEGLTLTPTPAPPTSLSYDGSYTADTKNLSAVMPGVGARPAD
ncbi:MAG: hypothetical protein WBD56_18180 [Anaerolineales bacterium]